MSKTQSDSSLITTREVFTVSRLNREVRALLEKGFGLIWLEGEISNLVKPASGHLYFSLKDDSAQIRCALFRGKQKGLGFKPENGMQVVARARVGLYEPRGDFQLIVESLEAAGEGELRRKFELLKKQLLAEGLFDTDHKRELPSLPRRIGIITSPSGAVIHDIQTTLARRFPAIPLLLYPVPVQGAGAAEKIAEMITLASRRAECDAIILARGGGSLEDLWAFNEEVVARAIYACRLPVVCGVGHEVDFTIADLVADVRAPTPTAAAEMLSPDQGEIKTLLQFYGQRLQSGITGRLNDARQGVDRASMRLVHPQERISRVHEKLAYLSQRRQLALKNQLHIVNTRIRSIGARLNFAATAIDIRQMKSNVFHLGQQLRNTFSNQARQHSQHLQRIAGRLHALSPLATLDRGYSILSLANGKIINGTKGLNRGDKLHARLAQGELDCVVEDINESN